MADNVEFPVAAGTKALTDDCTTGHAQIVKLAYSADGVATLVTVDTNGMLVNLGANNDVTVTGTVTVDGSGVTQPVSAASLPLPSGASTAAKQPALGTAGAPSADVITVQGVTSMTALKVDGSAVTQPVSGTVAVTNAGLTELAAAINASSQMDVNIAAAGAAVPVTDNSGSLTVDAPVGTPVFVRLSDGSAAIATLPVSLASVPSHAVTNAGTFATQVDGAALTALQLIDDPVIADDAAFTIGTSKVMMSGGAVVAHGSNPDAADAGDGGAPILNRHRVPFVIGGHPNQKTCTYLWTGATTDDNIMAAISAGTKYVVTRLTFTLDQACTVGVAARVGFGTASVPALPAANADAVDDILFYHPGMVPGTMHTVGDGIGILGVGGDGAELRITAGATTGGTGVVSVTYYTIES